MLMENLIGEALLIMVRNGLTTENLNKIVEMLAGCGRKISEKVKEACKNPPEKEVPPEVQEELKLTFREILESSARPVYMGGIALFFDEEVDEKMQKKVLNILNHFTGEWEDEEEVPENEDERKRVVRNREWVDTFMMYHFICDPLGKEDFEFEGNCLYLNFEFPTNAAGHIYNSVKVREFIDGMNYLLGMEKFIVSYAIY